ncbi:MAG TPA: class I SAM-dependent methyltransferase [Pyrinomonadaceae bacterium]|jgi:SAM-dependent methyltransferase|nr:class I SAM-dependent methyltransferase [Pyrinomonadaceae bacterium]
MEDDLLKLAGIKDVAGFYRDRFLTGGVFEASYFDALDRFDIKYARTMWIYDNVRRGSSVLDLGCGEGLLALLKRKDVYLAGVDLSPELVEMAQRNGYDSACVGLLTDLPFPTASFDYVVSLDVFGHIGFDEKDAVLREIKRVLKPDGVTMHGIESLDPKLHPDYHSMSPEKLAHFVSIDGHIGLEVDEDIADRFARFFSSVQTEPRYTLCLSVAEFIKQFDEYGAPFDADFIDYLRGLSFDERHAFDMAMGYVFGKISDLDLQLPSSGLYLLVKASDAALEPFYNAHRDRSDLFSAARGKGAISLDRHSRAVFGNGWYPANYLPPIARWMSGRSSLRFEAGPFTRLRLQLTTHIPDLRTSPMLLEFRLNGVALCELCLFDYGWLDLTIDVPEAVTRRSTDFKIEINADRTWQPSVANPNSSDDRHLSIAVCNLEIS